MLISMQKHFEYGLSMQSTTWLVWKTTAPLMAPHFSSKRRREFMSTSNLSSHRQVARLNPIKIKKKVKAWLPNILITPN